ncbi:hypothetical protein [Saccharothrix syringae]|uniref:Uncharacterized protein n=1 Tax=Saccharothrix syringae TaxID=103733 RepID=A0A5Q0H0F1_SACSY|nr:hypothetical protein [Saccharothrix syringae]QFZ19334.1 hypothetical protein EKG83_19525 [Saccharothrix syringae]
MTRTTVLAVPADSVSRVDWSALQTPSRKKMSSRDVPVSSLVSLPADHPRVVTMSLNEMPDRRWTVRR